MARFYGVKFIYLFIHLLLGFMLYSGKFHLYIHSKRYGEKKPESVDTHD